MYSNENFGLRLRQLRMEARETQKDLAALLGVKPNQIGEMENGRKASTFERLALICEHYNISANYLLCLTDSPERLHPEPAEEAGQV